MGHEEEQQTHLPVEQGIAGAAPVVPAISFSCEVKQPAGLLSRSSWCESMRESQFFRIRGSQRTRLTWDQEKPGATPGYPTTIYPGEVKQPAGPLKPVVMVRVHAGKPLSFPSVAQKQSRRPITGRPWRDTTRKDQFFVSNQEDCCI